MPSDSIWGILEDDQGRLWLSTANGLSRFDPRMESFRNYDVSDGLQSDTFLNFSVYSKSQSGEMLFVGSNGFNTFYPDQIMDITMPNFNGIGATRQIVSEVPSAKVVALSIHAGKHFVEDMLQDTELPPVSILSRHLVNDLDEIEDPFILVLDDFHKIHEKTVHDLMGALLTHPPQNLHLMLLIRRDPPLLTSLLRGRGQVNEIGSADLHFTEEETAGFF